MELQFAFAAFVAGMLTILAPCILPVLPIVVGGSADSKGWKKPVTITAALMVSVVAFTMLVRASTDAIGISTRDLQTAAGYILAGVGFFMVFPQVWDTISTKLGFSRESNKFMGKFLKRGDTLGDILIGASLGPVFTSCSPTYAAILSIALLGDTTVALGYLILYAIGLGLMLLVVAFAGQAAVKRLGWATDPHGWFKRIVGLLFFLVGVAIITGFDKTIETWLIERGLYEPFAEFENNLRE